MDCKLGNSNSTRRFFFEEGQQYFRLSHSLSISTPQDFLFRKITKMAVKRRSTKRVTRRKAAKVPRAAKKSVRRATRKVARKAAKTPRAPKRRRTSKRVSKRAVRKSRKPRIKYGSMRRVWSGTVDRTKGGLTKKDLCMNKRGKIVSKARLKVSQKAFKNSALSKWVEATTKARKELGLTGFVACKKGTAFYKLSKKYYN